MSSSPPRPHPDSSAPVRLAFRERLALEEGSIFFSVEGAPPWACHTERGAGGSLTFTTSLIGRVGRVDPDKLLMETRGHTLVIRYLLPGLIDLAGLTGRTVMVTVQQRYWGRGRATIDTVIRLPEGRLVLWARDGRLPSDREARGLPLRLYVVDGGHRLAASHPHGVLTLAAPGHASIHHEGELCDLLLIRLRADDACFVIIAGP